MSQNKAKNLKGQRSTSRRKIFIVEDHPVFREGLAQILNNESDLMVCGMAESANKALQAIFRLNPDLVLVDIGLPDKNGLELIKEIRTTNRKVKLLVVSMFDEALYADRVLRAGGDGYIMKQENPEEIIHAIRDVLDGHIYVSEEVMASTSKTALKPIAKTMSRSLDQLSDLELNILESLGRGKNNDEIADQYHLNAEDTAAHCSQMKKKLKLKSDNALIRYAVCWVETGAV